MNRKLYDVKHKYRIPMKLSAELRPYVLKINADTQFRNRMISGIPVIYKNDSEVISRDCSIFAERLASPDKWVGVVTQLELDYDPHPNTDLDAAHLVITNPVLQPMEDLFADHIRLYPLVTLYHPDYPFPDDYDYNEDIFAFIACKYEPSRKER